MKEAGLGPLLDVGLPRISRANGRGFTCKLVELLPELVECCFELGDFLPKASDLGFEGFDT